jgi:hypothetical protein
LEALAPSLNKRICSTQLHTQPDGRSLASPRRVRPLGSGTRGAAAPQRPHTRDAPAPPGRPALAARPRRGCDRRRCGGSDHAAAQLRPGAPGALAALRIACPRDPPPNADRWLTLTRSAPQLLGLRGRGPVSDPAIAAAHDAAAAAELDPAFSPLARLGRAKLLAAAREGLRAAAGRAALLRPGVDVEPALLAGALALLEQRGDAAGVFALAERARDLTFTDLAALGDAEALRELRRDAALASALARCALAKRALDAGAAADASEALEAALVALREGGGGRSGALAPELAERVRGALAGLKAAAVLEVLRRPADAVPEALRRRAVGALRAVLLEPGAADAGGAPLGPAYVADALAALTAREAAALLDWERAPAQAWWRPALGAAAGRAALVDGFARRRPVGVAAAARLLRAAAAASAGPADVDAAIDVSVAEVLLGRPFEALDILRADERAAAAAAGAPGARAAAPAPAPPAASPAASARRGPPPPAPVVRRTFAGDRNAVPGSIEVARAPGARAAVPFGGVAAAAPRAFPARDGVMAFVRAASPAGEADLLPGLCAFTEAWLAAVAFPSCRDARAAPPAASLAAYFEHPAAAEYLDAHKRPARVGAAAAGAAAAAHGALDAAAERAAGAAAAVRAALAAAPRPALAAAAGLVAVAVAAFGARAPAARQQQQLARAAAAAPAAAAPARRAAAAAVQAQALSRPAAERLVKAWLEAKAAAMGPRRHTERLSSVLAEPMLSAVRAEAREAATAGWFWQVRPRAARVDAVAPLDAAGRPAAPGVPALRATLLATIEEEAELWASNGKRGDAYRTTYKVEYAAARDAAGAWKITSALVLGK